MTVWEGFRVWLLSGLRELKPLDWSQRKVTFMAKTTWTFGKKKKKKVKPWPPMSKSCMSNPNMTFCWLKGKVISRVTARCQLTRKREESLCCCFFQWELIRSVLLSTVNQDNELGLNHDYKRFWRADWHWGSLHQCCVSVNPLIVLLRCRNGKMCVYTEWTVYLKNENSVVI